MSPANCGISQDWTSAQNPSLESHVTVVESLILNSVMAADVIAPQAVKLQYFSTIRRG